jgi:prophage tail gpP-like protein
MSRIIVKNASTGAELVWRHVTIKKSLDEICHTLTVELSASESGKVKKHHKIEVRFANPYIKDSGGARRVTTVLVDEITVHADIQKHGITVVGRSPARDIIDSTWSDDCADQTLGQITEYIGGKFGIACDTFPTNKPDPTENVSSFSWENESPWTKLIGEADNQGYILTSNEAGGLYIWPVASSVRGEGFHLTEGVNIKTIEWTENGAEQFHEYVVTGGFCDPERVIDSTCPGRRTLTIDITDPSITQTKLKRKAETERNRRSERRTTVTVPGWGLTDEQIKNLGTTEGKEIFWVPNILIPVKGPSIGLNAKLLISEVEYEASPENHGCKVTVVNREAYL